MTGSWPLDRSSSRRRFTCDWPSRGLSWKAWIHQGLSWYLFVATEVVQQLRFLRTLSLRVGLGVRVLPSPALWHPDVELWTIAHEGRKSGRVMMGRARNSRAMFADCIRCHEGTRWIVVLLLGVDAGMSYPPCPPCKSRLSAIHSVRQGGCVLRLSSLLKEIVKNNVHYVSQRYLYPSAALESWL